MLSHFGHHHRLISPDSSAGLACESQLGNWLPSTSRTYGRPTRADLEQYMFKRFEGQVNVDSEDLSILSNQQLSTLVEVFQDLEHYELAMSMIKLAPSQWNTESKNAWIHYVSKKYVDHHDVDISRGDCEQFQEELRQYWEDEHKKWCEAADSHERVLQLRKARNKFDDMKETARLSGLSHIHPSQWTDKDKENFCRWFTPSMESDIDMESSVQHRIKNELNQWQKTCDILITNKMMVPPSSTSSVQTIFDERSLTMKAMLSQTGAFLPSDPPMTSNGEFADPEDWDKETLNRWLEIQLVQYGFRSEDIRGISEKHRRLIMIYVRCAWPHDKDQYALHGLQSIFPNPTGTKLYCSIINTRPAPKQQEVNSKTESQRHRNRRDLHLWEFLLILLANPLQEGQSIHWKDQAQGKFELSNRNRVAKMWGLTKGNNRMTYDNMSRSVRQYYKEDDTGIMIRHKPGQPSFGKYSYQFSMSNSEVEKLWSSLISS